MELTEEEVLNKRKPSINSAKNGDTACAGGGDGAADGGEIQLKAKMSLLNGITVIVGSIIGSGIFVSPAGVLINTGSVNMSLIVWTISGVFSMVSSIWISAVSFAFNFELKIDTASRNERMNWENLIYLLSEC